MTYEEWIEKYKPVKNRIHQSAPYNGTMFETFGLEYTYVANQPNNHTWTLIDGDGVNGIQTGFHIANRLGYFITEVPWENEMDLAVDFEE